MDMYGRRKMTQEQLGTPLTKESVIHRIPDYYDKVATAAYFFAEQRGFEPGHEEADWLAAERYIQGVWLFQ